MNCQILQIYVYFYHNLDYFILKGFNVNRKKIFFEMNSKSI